MKNADHILKTYHVTSYAIKIIQITYNVLLRDIDKRFVLSLEASHLDNDSLQTEIIKLFFLLL